MEENTALARAFIQKYFVSDGMIADFAVHQPDKEDGGIPNPHFHVLVPIRPLNNDGTWGAKQHRVYHLDEEGKGDWTAPQRGYASKETSRVERQKPVCGIASSIAFPHYIEILTISK